MAQKFYVVWTGRQTGVFSDWATTHRHVNEFPGARFKSFPSYVEAEQAFRTGRPPPAGRRPAVQSAGTTARKEPPAAAMGLQIYCDGACDPNPGRAGSGIAVYRDGKLEQLWYGLFNPQGTNNTAELNALHHALLMAEAAIAAGDNVQILCDSTYAINCISKWAAGWQKNGWRKPGGEIKNLSIIRAAREVFLRIESRVHLTHVSAHVGTEGNELADRMAMYAVQSADENLNPYGPDIDIPSILRMRAG